MPMPRVSVPYLALRAMGRMLCHMTAVQGEPRPSNLEQGWTVDDGTFGARLALVRQRMQWNIKEAARECGVPAASWGTWEAGSLPRRYTEICAQIAERTGASYMWLLTGPRVGRSAIRDPNEPSAFIGHKDDPKRPPHVAPRPFGPPRREHTRPVSAIPATRRRPSPVRPGNRPMRDGS
jgi:hypothetical protein